MNPDDQPILFGLDYSVYTRIVRLVLAEKSIDYQPVETDVFDDNFDHKAYRSKHPFGKIPVLQHGSVTLYETSAICRYLDEAFPGIALQPVTAEARGAMNQVIGLLDSYAYRPLVWGVFVESVVNPLEGLTTDDEAVATALQASDPVLRELERRLENKSTYLVGKHLSLADLHAVPMLTCFAKASEGARQLHEYPHLTEWLERIQDRNSFQSTRSIYD